MHGALSVERPKDSGSSGTVVVSFCEIKRIRVEYTLYKYMQANVPNIPRDERYQIKFEHIKG